MIQELSLAEKQQINKMNRKRNREQLINDPESRPKTGHICLVCGFLPVTKNKYRELQDHLVRQHFADRIKQALPTKRPYICPEDDCGVEGKDWQALMRHFTGKHGVIEKYLNEVIGGGFYIPPNPRNIKIGYRKSALQPAIPKHLVMKEAADAEVQGMTSGDCYQTQPSPTPTISSNSESISIVDIKEPIPHEQLVTIESVALKSGESRVSRERNVRNRKRRSSVAQNVDNNNTTTPLNDGGTVLTTDGRSVVGGETITTTSTIISHEQLATLAANTPNNQPQLALIFKRPKTSPLEEDSYAFIDLKTFLASTSIVQAEETPITDIIKHDDVFDVRSVFGASTDLKPQEPINSSSSYPNVSLSLNDNSPTHHSAIQPPPYTQIIYAQPKELSQLREGHLRLQQNNGQMIVQPSLPITPLPPQQVLPSHQSVLYAGGGQTTTCFKSPITSSAPFNNIANHPPNVILGGAPPQPQATYQIIEASDLIQNHTSAHIQDGHPIQSIETILLGGGGEGGTEYATTTDNNSAIAQQMTLLPTHPHSVDQSFHYVTQDGQHITLAAATPSGGGGGATFQTIEPVTMCTSSGSGLHGSSGLEGEQVFVTYTDDLSQLAPPSQPTFVTHHHQQQVHQHQLDVSQLQLQNPPTPETVMGDHVGLATHPDNEQPPPEYLTPPRDTSPEMANVKIITTET